MNIKPKFTPIFPAPEDEVLLEELPLDVPLAVDEAVDVAVSVEAAVLSVEVAVDVTSLVAVPLAAVTDAPDEVGNLSLGNVIILPLAVSVATAEVSVVLTTVPLPAAVLLTPVVSVELACVSAGSEMLVPPAVPLAPVAVVSVSMPGAVESVADESVAMGGTGVCRPTVVVLAADVTVVSVSLASGAGWAAARARKRRRGLLRSCILRLWGLEWVR